MCKNIKGIKSILIYIIQKNTEKFCHRIDANDSAYIKDYLLMKALL